MQKRGTLTLKGVIEIVVGAFVIFSLMAIGSAFGSHEVFQKLRVSRDAALAISTLHAFPGNGWLAIPYDTSKYSFDFLENGVVVFKQRGEGTGVTYPYVSKGEIKQQSVDNPEILYLEVNGNDFSASDKLSRNLYKYYCLRSKESLNNQEILFDIEPTVPGVIAFDLLVTQLDVALGQRAKIGCQGCSQIIPLTNEDVFIKLETLNEADKFKAYFYYNSEESKNLGCFILNKLSDNFPEAKISLIPSDELEDKKDKTNLIIRLGSLEIDKISSAMTEAIEGYYG